jgi:hypothetical protein
MIERLELDGVLTPTEAETTARHLCSLQQPNGMIPWFPGGHCDPWNHVESAMALDAAGYHGAARRAYGWLAAIQRADGSWHNYYHADGSVKDAKLDSNVCAYLATGLLHHLRISGDVDFVRSMFPSAARALDFVLSLRRADGVPLWAIETNTRPWDYALLTGTASIQHALHCGARLADALGEPRADWSDAADVITAVIQADCASRPALSGGSSHFEPKTRWAMDWYYPVLTGALTGGTAKARLAEGWKTFSMDGLGIRCVSDEPWVTASETAECAIAFTAIGDHDTATDLLRWTRTHRRDDGAYWTGIVYPDEIRFPFDEHTSYTAAAVLLAVDAIVGGSPASDLFSPGALVD